jgi:hypothetical protein
MAPRLIVAVSIDPAEIGQDCLTVCLAIILFVGAPLFSSFPAKAGIQNLDRRPCEQVWVPPREGGDCAGKAEGGLLRHQRLGLAQIDRNQLRHAALGHGHAKQTVHARHGHRIMGDGDKARFGSQPHLG